MGNFIFGAATATALSYAYVMFGWSVPAIFELPGMIRALPEKVAVIELIDDPALTEKAKDCARRTGLAFERRYAGYGGLEVALRNQSP